MAATGLRRRRCTQPLSGLPQRQIRFQPSIVLQKAQRSASHRLPYATPTASRLFLNCVSWLVSSTPTLSLRTASVATRACRFESTDPAVMHTFSHSGLTLLPTDLRQS